MFYHFVNIHDIKLEIPFVLSYRQLIWIQVAPYKRSLSLCEHSYERKITKRVLHGLQQMPITDPPRIN